jgi:hypothetical protein
MRVLLRDDRGRVVELDTQGESNFCTIEALCAQARDTWRAMGWPMPAESGHWSADAEKAESARYPMTVEGDRAWAANHGCVPRHSDAASTLQLPQVVEDAEPPGFRAFGS